MNLDDVKIRTFYVARFDNSINVDSYVQSSISLPLEDAKKFLQSERNRFPDENIVILAVLDL